VSIEKNIEILNYNLVQYIDCSILYLRNTIMNIHPVFLYFILVSNVSTHCVETHCRYYYPIISLKICDHPSRFFHVSIVVGGK
jgi:hypothetical protein